MLHKIELN